MAEKSIGPVFQLSVVDVCNNSLDQIGQEPIASLDEGSAAGRACRRYFPTLLRAMLRDHKWNFAKRRVYLPQITQTEIIAILTGFGGGGFGGGGFGGAQQDLTITAVPGPYTYWYGTPNNMVRAWQINSDPSQGFEIEGRILMTAHTSVLLEYEAYIDDPNVWDGMFQMAFETALASRLCLRLIKDAKEAAVFGSRT